MKIEIDSSDMEYASYYKDDKCNEIERLIQNDARFPECTVKRQHFDSGDLDLDPFVLLDTNGKEIITLERWEIDTLNDSELLSFILLQSKRGGDFDYLGSFALLISLILLLPFLSWPFGPSSPQLVLLSFILMAFIGILYRSRSRAFHSKIINMELDAIRSDSNFLSALRKLAAVPESDYVYKKGYVKRLKLVEEVLSGTES